jgi:Trypsin
MRRLILLLATIGVMVLLASGAALAITGGWVDDGKKDPDKVVDGETVQEPDPNVIKYPNVGALVNRTGAYCSGTLVDGINGDPVFVTAAHCEEPGPVYVTFDSTYQKEQSEFPNGPGVEYRGTLRDDGQWYVKGHDIAVVVFDSNSTPPSTITREDGTTQDVIPAQLPTLGQLADTAKDAPFTAVGYGDTSGTSNDYGTRRYAVSTFKSVDQTYLRLSQHNGSGGTCYGDSGGPNFLGAPEATNVIASTTITGDTWCKATNVTLRLDTVEAQNILAGLGVKLRTQCFDGLDNDNDGKSDFGGTDGDPGCTSATDNSES